MVFNFHRISSNIHYCICGGYNFHDGVYRGEKWEFDFGKPKKNYITIIPKDIPESRVHGNGYIVRDTSLEKTYDIILLSDQK